MKRFEFDYNNMQRLKINDYCEFPEKISFKPWTKEGIREREKASRNRANPTEIAEVDEKENLKDALSGEEIYEDGSVQDEEMEDRGAKGPNSGAAPIDEDLESESNVELDQSDDEMMIEDEENINSIMNTGKYFDEGVMEDFIDIAADDDEDKSGVGKKHRSHKLKRMRTKARSESQQLPIEIEEENKLDSNQSASKKKRSSKVKKEDSYYEYELAGVLVHSGSADSGHYYSFIKERQQSNQNRWLEFNDTHVREFDIKNLGIECFGGNQDVGGAKANKGLLDDFSPADARQFERCRNAYLLFYERIDKSKNLSQTKQ